METAKSGQDAPSFGFCLAKNSLSWIPFLKQMCLVLLPLPLVPLVVYLPLLLCFWPLITLSILAGTSCQWIPTKLSLGFSLPRAVLLCTLGETCHLPCPPPPAEFIPHHLGGCLMAFRCWRWPAFYGL